MVFFLLKNGFQNSIYPFKTKINGACTRNYSEEKKHVKHKGFFIQKRKCKQIWTQKKQR